MKKLLIKNLGVTINNKQILKNLSLTVKSGEIHALMGPNGAGKSTLSSALMGDQNYELTNGSVIKMNGESLVDLSPNERALQGLFMSFQNPVEIPGLRIETFLREVHKNKFGGTTKEILKAIDFRKYINDLADEYGINTEFLKRGLNEDFSGGEKKRLEILQMAMIKPDFAILDEMDSGLDIDALRNISSGVNKIIAENNTGVIIITHYQRILDYIKPDFVHVIKSGEIVKSGGKELVKKLEEDGYGDI